MGSKSFGTIRDVELTDAPAILEIYRPFVENTITSFEYKTPSLQEMESRIAKIKDSHPYLVYTEGEKVHGYAYASPHREREGYNWVAETSIYLAPEARGKGIGRKLYTELLNILEELGFYTAMAGISGSNPVSDKFHRSFGFKLTVVWPNFGNKFGQWIDVSLYKKEIRKTDKVFPDLPMPYSEYRKRKEVKVVD